MESPDRPAPGGRLQDLQTQGFQSLQPLLDEEAEVLWRTLRWQVEPCLGPLEGLAWVAGGRVLGYLPLRVSGNIVVLGRMFATRDGPTEAVEAELLHAAIAGAFSRNTIQGVFGELLAVAPATLDQLRALGPALVRMRSLMQVSWSPSGEIRTDARLEPWQGDRLGDASGLLWRCNASVPHFLPDPALNNRQGIAFLLEWITSQPLCGNFAPEASFLARAPGTGELLGFILASRMGADQGHLIELAVEPGARRQGIGTALVTGALEALRKQGCRTTHIAVNQDNAQAIALYQRLGFQEFHRFPNLRLERRPLLP